MTAAKAFCILSALLGGGSIYCNRRNDAELRRTGVL